MGPKSMRFAAYRPSSASTRRTSLMASRVVRCHGTDTPPKASPTTSWCPYKGEASYVSLTDGARDIGWSYETPLPAMSAIAGYIAFYAGKVVVEDA